MTQTPHARTVFADRREAGRVLAQLLEGYRGTPGLVVLGLARGGVPVAFEIAAALGAPLDAYIVRKLGAPGREEFALGAIAGGGHVVVNDDMLRALRVPTETLRAIAEREGRELARREAAYRGGRGPLDVAGKAVVLVDDGLATGASMFAAVEALREQEPHLLVVAVPAAPESTVREFEAMVDEVVCASMPSPFLAVGESYWDFAQVTDDEVRALLATPTAAPAAAARPPVAPASPAGRVRAAAVRADRGVPPLRELLDLVGDARVVMIGESTHGSHEFYAARAEMTKALVEHKGFRAVAAEADWPDAYRANRYARGADPDRTAEEALRGFQRFPSWMWRNTVVRDFVEWLRERNQRAADDPVGFYGLDLYSLHRSMREVVAYLEKVDPAAADRARRRYACFDRPDGDDGQSYGYAAAYGAGEVCERQAVEQLMELRRRAADLLRRDGAAAEDELFYAERNAATVQNAEEYYRTMFGGRVSSWNLRDQHMAQTLDALLEHLGRRGGTPAKVVVWAHNSHVGDARATEVGAQGQLTLGQLARERHGRACRLIGMSTYTGTVTAAGEWGGPAERKNVRPGLPSSSEALLHDTGEPSFWVRCDAPGAAGDLRQVRLYRAIGVIYRPDTERHSHYFHTRLGDQFDAVVHIDTTSALEPLERTSLWVAGQTPETYPTGL